MPDRPSFKQFAERLRQGAFVLGTFVKTPTSHATEQLGLIGYDFVVIDREHAPIGMGAMDTMLLAARAAGIAAIVRVPDGSATGIQAALDAGAAGVLVPHVKDAATARSMVAHCRYRSGTRGFANTTRAGDFGRVAFGPHMDAQASEVAAIAMIEDLATVDVIDDILSVEGLDAIFVGRGDLSAALGENAMNAEAVMAVVRPIMAAARKRGTPAIFLCTDAEDARAMRALGATALMMGSDHGFMMKAAGAALETLRSAGADSEKTGS